MDPIDWVIIGLGNPGGKYENTRHNIGWLLLDRLESMGSFGRPLSEAQSVVKIGRAFGARCITVRPQTFMNESGRAGREILGRYQVPLDHVVVAHDDMDLPFGRLKVTAGSRAAGQKGVASLIESWKTTKFPRIRIGIGRPPEGWDPMSYVLGVWTPRERQLLQDVLMTASIGTEAIIARGVDAAMAAVNGVVIA